MTKINSNLRRFSIKRILSIVIVFAFALIAIVNIKVNAAAQAIELIFCNPGENCSTSVNFAWHAAKPTTTFYYTLDSDTEFQNAKSFQVNGIYDGATYSKEDIKNYKFELSLTDLSPNTTYIYKITAANGKSEVQSFTTAGTSGSFEFVWYSDNHAYSATSCTERVTYLTKLMGYVEKEHNIDFIIQSGDNVSYGGAYYCWQQDYTSGIFNNHIFATTPGNHETYMYPEGSSTEDEDATKYFRSMFNNPDNGYGSDTDQSYWYIYNSILFIALDAISAHNSNECLKNQKKWFGEVVEANEGNYQYIIVYQHYPWLNALTGEHSGPYGTNRNTWYEVFDKYDVDLALAGDHHFAYRSKRLLGDEILEDDDIKGTVYIGAPQIGARDRAMEDDKDPEYYAWRSDDTTASSGTSGLTCFTVTPEGITGQLIDLKGEVIDSYTIPAKRSVTWEGNKTKINESYIFTSNGTDSAVDMNTSYADCVKNIKVYNGDTLVGEADYTTGNYGSIKVEGLEANKAYELKVVTNFVDNTSLETKVYGSTYKNYGMLYGFNASSNGDKIKLSFKSELKNDIVSSYKLFIDGKETATLKTTDTSYEISKANVSINSVYKLIAYSNTGEVIKELVATYSVYGDSNMDGAVNNDDVTNILKLIREGHEFGENEIRLLDQNGDNKIDIADATVEYNFNKRQISSLHQETFTVIAIDNNGLVLSIQEVKYGENAKAPEIKSASFDYWSDSFEYITSDVVIKSIYK